MKIALAEIAFTDGLRDGRAPDREQEHPDQESAAERDPGPHLRLARGIECAGTVASGELRVHLRREDDRQDRKSTRLNSSHGYISYAVFCLKKKKKKINKAITP